MAVSKARANWDSLRMRRRNSKDIALQDLRPNVDTTGTVLPPSVPAPPYRHAAPSGPWPWMDFSKIDDMTVTTQDTTSIDESWRGYPQNLFGNWTPDQVGRSQILMKCSKNQSSTIYWMDVLDNGMFARASMGNGDTTP
ncbi:hypothetical protein M405DRAFT_879332, partial [Rhizopogon salebrosus TDB-379]